MVFSAYILSWNILYAEPNKGILLLLLLLLLLTSSSSCFSSSSFLPPHNGSQYIAKVGFKLIRLLRSSCLGLLNAGTIGVDHHIQCFFFSKVFYLLRECFRGLEKKWNKDVAFASMEGLGEMIPQKKLSKVEERVDFPNSQSTRYVLAMVEGNV